MARTGIIWEKTFEPPNNNRDGLFTHNKHEYILVRSAADGYPVRSGEYSLELRLAPQEAGIGTYRSMVMMSPNDDDPWDAPGTILWAWGDEIWYGFSMYWPENWVADNWWEIDIQWQNIGTGTVARNPVFALEMPEADRTPGWGIFRVRHDATPGDTAGYSVSSTNVDLRPYFGKWTDWVFHIKTSNGSDGICEVWADGVQVLDHHGPVGVSGEGHYPSLGVYRRDWETSSKYWESVNDFGVSERVVYIDEIRMGRAALGAGYDDVAPEGSASDPGEPEPPEEYAGQVYPGVSVHNAGSTEFTNAFEMQGLTPKLVLFSASKATAFDSEASDVSFSYGAATRYGGLTQQWAVSVSARDGVTRTNTARRATNNSAILLLDPATGGVLAEGRVTGWIADGVQLQWVTPPPQTYQVSCLMLAGSDVEARAGVYTPGGTTTDVSVGFDPHLVLFAGNGPIDDTTRRDINVSLGAWSSRGQQGSLTLYSDDNTPFTSYLRGRITDAECYHWFTAWNLSCSAISGGFRTLTSGTKESEQIGYVAIRCGAAPDVQLVPMGETSYALPFTPTLGISLASPLETADAWVYGDGGGHGMNVGFFTKPNQYSVGWHSDFNNPTATRDKSVVSPAAVRVHDEDGTVLVSGTLDANNDGSWDWTYTASSIAALTLLVAFPWIEPSATSSEVGGVLGVAGTIGKEAHKSPRGTLRVAGALSRAVGRAVQGALQLVGSVETYKNGATAKVLAGVVGFSGRAVRLTAKALSGTLSAEGGTQDRWAKALPRTWDGLSGALSRRITALRRGAIALAGSARRYSTTLRSVPRSELTLAPRSTSLTLPNRRPEDDL